MNRFKELRLSAGKSQAQVAQWLSISQAAYSKYECGKAEPSLEALDILSKKYNVSVDYLLGRDELHLANEVPFDFDFVGIPVLAELAAGYNKFPRKKETPDLFPVPRLAMHGYPQNELVVFIVKGNSMYPDLKDGDRVLVHKQDSVDSGETAVIAYNGDEATIKKVRYVSGQDWLELIPRNPEYETRRIEGGDLQECRVIGKVLSLIYREMS